jgi:hypothetical protein
MMTTTDIQSVREVLQQFQSGYDHRDGTRLDEIRALFADDPTVEVIGTGGLVLGDEEWPMGREAVLELVKNDWEGWGDLRLELDQARIHCLGEAAWLATDGTVTMELKQDNVYANYLSGLQATVANTELDARSRLLEVLRGSSNTLFEGERGDQYVWPIRFTAVLVCENGKWLFHQMQFSFATTRFPDVRKL